LQSIAQQLFSKNLRPDALINSDQKADATAKKVTPENIDQTAGSE